MEHLLGRIETQHPAEVVAALAAAGHTWVVVQSLNLICGHEFYRLVDDVQGAAPAYRVSVGHSLLCNQADHQALCAALASLFDQTREEAVVLVGHGTDHCIWTAYLALYLRLRERYGRRAFGGMIEDGYPDRGTLIDAIVKESFKRVRLMPFMLVSGVHFEEDLAGEKNSWKSACEARGLSVSLETCGLGERPAVIDIFAYPSLRPWWSSRKLRLAICPRTPCKRRHEAAYSRPAAHRHSAWGSGGQAPGPFDPHR